MFIEQDLPDPFTIQRGLLTLPDLVSDIPPAWLLSATDKELRNSTFYLDVPDPKPLQNLQADFFKLDLHDVPLLELDSSSQSANTSDAETSINNGGVFEEEGEWSEDIWALPDVVSGGKSNRLVSWDTFLNEDHIEPPATYLSERNEGFLFTKLLAVSESKSDTVLRAAKPLVFQSSLRQLGFGLDSLFFLYDPTKKTFSQDEETFMIRGLSFDIVSSLTSDFIGIGEDMRALRVFTECGSTSSRQPQPTRVAVTSAISLVMQAVVNLIEGSKEEISTLLQLQEVFRGSGLLVCCLRSLAETPQDWSNDNASLASLLAATNKQSDLHPWLAEILQEVTTRSATAYIRNLGVSIGLEHSIKQSEPTENVIAVDYHGDQQALDILPGEVRQLVLESHRSLELLRKTCADHVLLNQHFSLDCSLQWKCSFDEIASLQIRAAAYEQELKRAILTSKQNNAGCSGVRTLGGDLASNKEPPRLDFGGFGIPDFEDSVRSYRPLGSDLSIHQDKLVQMVNTALQATDTWPTASQPGLDQSLSWSLLPLIAAQHRLLSYSVLCFLFENHHLTAHLAIQHRFQLFGDGIFASRLSLALFDSSQASGEGRRKTGASTGLRLQSRDTWPPASSELRLVLMNLLTDSFESTNRTKSPLVGDQQTGEPISNLISFAVRDLADEELERCRNADTIYALDFLSLQYRPTSPTLECVITPKSLDLYDRIFMQLLRLLRVRSVSQDLLRDLCRRNCVATGTKRKDHKFRIEVQHFISTLADWIQNVVVGGEWAKFDATIARVESCVRKQDYEGVLEAGKGIVYLRALHEGVLEDISRNLFLRKKQVEVKAVLDEIFEIVLQLAKHSRESAGSSGDEATIERLYDNFRKQAGRFRRYLKAAASEPGANGSSGQANVGLLEQLGTRLDFLGYYAS